VVKARKIAEREGEEHIKTTPTPNGQGVQVDVGVLLDYGVAQGPMIEPIVATFDATQIMGQDTTLAAIRFLYLSPLTEKLQSPQNVFPFYRAIGGDSKGTDRFLNPEYFALHQPTAAQPKAKKEEISSVSTRPRCPRRRMGPDAKEFGCMLCCLGSSIWT